jgi:hypothetical protein
MPRFDSVLTKAFHPLVFLLKSVVSQVGGDGEGILDEELGGQAPL